MSQRYQRSTKALHRTAIPLRSIAAGELHRWADSSFSNVIGAELMKRLWLHGPGGGMRERLSGSLKKRGPLRARSLRIGYSA